jgi:MFS transporter, DHA1 family, multidrug resistance protein
LKTIDDLSRQKIISILSAMFPHIKIYLFLYYYPSLAIVLGGIWLVLLGTFLFVILTFTLGLITTSKLLSLIITLLSMVIIMIGIGMIIPNCLSLALDEYKYAIGTASSFFGFFYYVLISLFTLVMGLLHNETLFPMPIYFFAIALLMISIFFRFIAEDTYGKLRYSRSL